MQQTLMRCNFSHTDTEQLSRLTNCASPLLCIHSCAAYGAATLCALLAGSEETYERVAGDQEALASLVAVLQVPQLDTQKAALLALCSLVPSAQGGKSARKEWGRGGVAAAAASGQREFQVRRCR